MKAFVRVLLEGVWLGLALVRDYAYALVDTVASLVCRSRDVSGLTGALDRETIEACADVACFDWLVVCETCGKYRPAHRPHGWRARP